MGKMGTCEEGMFGKRKKKESKVPYKECLKR